LFLGTWILRKGAAEIAAAITEVLRGHPHVRFTAAGCGVPDSTVLADFPADLHSRITVLPRIEGTRQLTDVYARHSIFILPSYYEGHPLAMVEAAAMRMAIITTATCGMLDFVQDGSNGLLIPVGDAGALSSAVRRLIADAGLRRALGDAVFGTAERHTWSAAAAGILRAYQSAIARARHPVSGRAEVNVSR
jgi:glycosyltransferase involved in cell wall biosynthesis